MSKCTYTAQWDKGFNDGLVDATHERHPRKTDTSKAYSQGYQQGYNTGKQRNENNNCIFVTT